MFRKPDAVCSALFKERNVISSLFLPDYLIASWILHLRELPSVRDLESGRDNSWKSVWKPRPVGRPMTQRTSGARTLFSMHNQSSDTFCFANDISDCVSWLHVVSCPYHQHYMPQIGSNVQSNCKCSMIRCNISGTCQTQVPDNSPGLSTELELALRRQNLCTQLSLP